MWISWCAVNAVPEGAATSQGATPSTTAGEDRGGGGKRLPPVAARSDGEGKQGMCRTYHFRVVANSDAIRSAQISGSPFASAIVYDETSQCQRDYQ